MARRSNPETIQLWQRRLEDQLQSQIAVRAFCELHGIPTHSFYFWRRKLTSSSSPSSSNPSNGLIAVRVTPNLAEDQKARIQFACGASLEASAEILRIAIDQILASERALGAKSC